MNLPTPVVDAVGNIVDDIIEDTLELEDVLANWTDEVTVWSVKGEMNIWLGTLVPNSRDWHEKKWQPNFLRFKAHLKISFTDKSRLNAVLILKIWII